MTLLAGFVVVGAVALALAYTSRRRRRRRMRALELAELDELEARRARLRVQPASPDPNLWAPDEWLG